MRAELRRPVIAPLSSRRSDKQSRSSGSTSSDCLTQTVVTMSVSHETCLLDQVLELIMNEKPPTSASLFLNEDADKPPLPDRGDLRRRLCRAMERRASSMKERMSSVSRDSVRSFLRRNLFVLFTVAAVALGVILGFALRPYNLSLREIKYFAFPGELLMRMLQMLVLPLIISSLVTGISSLDSKASGKMGVRAVVYYMVTTLVAVFIGIVIVIIIRPGKGSRDSPVAKTGNIEPVQAADAFLDLIRNMFPPNLVEACFKQYRTVYKKIVHTRNVTVTLNLTESLNMTESNLNLSRVLHTIQETVEETVEETVPVSGSSSGVNALGLVVFSMCFGLVIGNMKQQGQALRDFFDCLNEAIMRLVAVIIWYAPVGILFLIAGKIVEMKDLAEVGGQLAMYTVSVIVGLLIHGLFVLPLLYFLVTRRNPYSFISGLLQALITALGTSSSSATLPITFRCLEENNHVDKRVTRFVLPVGATINMDGTALYEAVAAIFIAQVNDMDLNFGQILTISITATAASIGAAGIPQAGLVTMVIVLTSVGLPTEDITLIIAVDWFLDRLRTTTNVLGDSLGAGIVEHLSRGELQNQDAEVRNSVIEENEKPYQLICQDNDVVNHLNSETTM
ncbi:excitatory amino acid transporter 4 isoform X1 [Acanthochromis polyacanthus]|uniref:excitatory amino acid transporter 4 isoform X1 n=1 Tax=Acanthochromis polyacanthus TaxID=80966 RepID=UPI0022340A5F|nr:excitatory amino acid transporter 4 isoform X1 [Acanthochromis polyacanthus]